MNLKISLRAGDETCKQRNSDLDDIVFTVADTQYERTIRGLVSCDCPIDNVRIRRKFDIVSFPIRTQRHDIKVCSHGTAATTIFITTNGLHRIQYKCSRGAIATTSLNSIQAVSSKRIAVAIAACEQPFREVTWCVSFLNQRDNYVHDNKSSSQAKYFL